MTNASLKFPGIRLIWLDIDSNFGLASDLRIDRADNEGNRRVTVKDYTGTTDEYNELLTTWFDINKVWSIDDVGFRI